VVDALVPEWNDGNSTTHTPATGFALIEGIVTALHELATRRTLMLVLDDLQLADEASLDAVTLLVAELPRIPIHVIGNWTFFGAGRPLNRPSFERLLGANDTTAVHLDGVDRQAAARLVAAVAGAPTPQAVTDELWRQAGGNPFYLKELARSRSVAGRDSDLVTPPESVVGVVGRRLAALGRPARRVLDAAAVIGPEFDVADLSDVVELPVSAVQARLRPAYEAGLIDELPEQPGGYHFGHGLLREAVLTQLPGPDRSALHAAVAVTRAAALAGAAYEFGIAAADHAWRAGADLNPKTALEVHETVIARALTRSAYDDVAGLADHALQLCRRLPAKPEHLERQATLWLHLAGAKGILDGQGSAAATAAVQRAFEIGCEARGRSYYGAIAMQCLMLSGHGRIEEAAVIATGLREQYERSDDPDIGVASDFVHVMIHALRGEVAASISAGQHMMETFAPAETVADPTHFFHPRVLCWMALGEATRGDRHAMNDYAQRALHLARRQGDVFNILAAKLVLVESAAILGDLSGTAAAADAVDREFSAAGGHQWAAVARIISIWARVLETGEGDSALAFEAFEVLTSDGTCAMNGMYLGLLADIETRCGRVEHAEELLARARSLASTTGEHAWDGFLSERLAAAAPATAERSTVARGVGQRRTPLPPHRAIGHQVQHAAESAGVHQRDQPGPAVTPTQLEAAAIELP
jgi:hypothetical protein